MQKSVVFPYMASQKEEWNCGIEWETAEASVEVRLSSYMESAVSKR